MSYGGSSDTKHILLIFTALLLVMLGYFCFTFDILASLVYFVYLLGPVGLTFGNAAWGGLVLWGKMMLGGAVSVIIGTVLIKQESEK